jgi:hypothetical protein
MASTNLGIAKVKAVLKDAAPYIDKNLKRFNFEVSAYDSDLIINSAFAKPLLAEYVEDPLGTFAAFHPSKRKFYLDNALSDGSSSTPAGFITWKPLTSPPPLTPSDIVNDGGYDTYTIDPPPLTPETDVPDDYKGPFFENNAVSMPPPPNDKLSIKGYLDWYSSSGGGATTTTTSSSTPWPVIQSVYQKKHHDGLWWGLESSEFLEEDNTPFWVNFRKMEAPSSANHETLFIIRLGPGDSEHQYDICISMDKRPFLIDYLTSGPVGGSVPPMIHEWDADFSRVISQKRADNDMEIGVMTIAGRLVVIVNNNPLVYARINRDGTEDGGQLLECKIKSGKIQVFATNVETRLIACPMTFAETSIISIPMPTIVEEGGGGGGGGTTPSYEGVDNHAVINGSVSKLPKPPSYADDLYGVDCEEFDGPGGGANPSGFGFHKKGKMKFQQASSTTFATLENTDFYTLEMNPSSDISVAGEMIPFSGCPYFFRLKGAYKKDSAPGGGEEDISDYVISVDETAQAPDYFHVKRSASITLYNEDNVIGDKVVNDQTVISLEWGWVDADGRSATTTKTFTGIVVSVSKSEIAGKETITLNCEDYIYILSKVPIINSPFYDGMVAVYAIGDLAERAGISGWTKDWDSEDDYFLPAGYGFSQPAMRFQSTQMIFECIIEMVKRFEAYIYFDAEGKFHINKLPGGLLSAPTTGPVADFLSDPFSDPAKAILEERSVDVSYDSTVNVISILTLERDTRNAIIYSKPASDDKLVFVKPYLYNQPAFGEMEAAKAWVDEVSQRMFFPILKTRFKTLGLTIVSPLDFVTLDDHDFRVMSVRRTFNAENNDLTCSYECEWLGGA